MGPVRQLRSPRPKILRPGPRSSVMEQKRALSASSGRTATTCLTALFTAVMCGCAQSQPATTKPPAPAQPAQPTTQPQQDAPKPQTNPTQPVPPAPAPPPTPAATPVPHPTS